MRTESSENSVYPKNLILKKQNNKKKNNNLEITNLFYMH